MAFADGLGENSRDIDRDLLVYLPTLAREYAPAHRGRSPAPVRLEACQTHG